MEPLLGLPILLLLALSSWSNVGCKSIKADLKTVNNVLKLYLRKRVPEDSFGDSLPLS